MDAEKTEKIDPEDKEAYESYISDLLKTYFTNQELFEKQLSYISAGALALSFAFIEKIVGPIRDALCVSALLFSWGLWVLALVVNLVSYPISTQILRSVLKYVYRVGHKFDRRKAANRTKIISYFNYVALALLISGIVCFSVFIYKNQM